MSHDVPVFAVFKMELHALSGTPLLATALYLRLLKPLADPQTGEVIGVTHKGLASAMTPQQNRLGGRKPPPVTVQHIRGALDHLVKCGLVQTSPAENRSSRTLTLVLAYPGTYEVPGEEGPRQRAAKRKR